MNLQRSTKSKKKYGKTFNRMELIKMEIAENLGLLDKIKSYGWSGLTASESGKIGGMMNKKIKKEGEEQDGKKEKEKKSRTSGK
jgi:hypothetical protein